MLANDLLKRYMFNFGVIRSYKMAKNHQKITVLWKWANLHIYSIIQKKCVKLFYVNP